MKRTDLIALAERLAHAAEYVRSASPTLSEPDAAWVADQDAAVSLMHQIAQAQPVRGAVFGMYGVERINLVADGSEREWVDKCGGSLLYTLPLED